MPKAFIETPYFADLTNRALAYLQAGYAVHFCGPAGVGKTALAMHTAELLGRSIMVLHGNDEYNPSDLVGGHFGLRRKKVLDNYVHTVWKAEENVDSVWYDGRLAYACRNGLTLVYDEFTRSRPETNNVLLSVLQERTLDLSTYQKGETKLKVHSDFTAIFTSNPTEYAGVHPYQDALRDRMITIDLNYLDREAEIAIVAGKAGLPWREAARIVDIVHALRGKETLKGSVRAAIMIGTILTTKGIKPSRDNSFFYQVIEDVLGSEFPEGTLANRQVLKERIKYEVDRYSEEGK